MKSVRNLLILVVVVILGLVVTAGEFHRTSAGEKQQRSRNVTRSFVAGDIAFLTEDFDYSVGDLTAANAAWTAHSGGTTNAIQVTSPGLTYPNYAGSAGNAVSMTNTGQDVNRLFSAPAAGTVYASLLVNVNASQTTGDYFFHYFVNSSTFFGRVFVKKDVSTENFSFGISRTASNSGTPIYTPASYSLNQTYLLVVKYTVNPGTNDDTASLFVNPVIGDPEPSPTVIATDVLVDDPANLPGIGLRQGTNTSASTQRVDGIRVGTSWASVVVGSAPEPNGRVDLNGDGISDFLVTRIVGGSGFTATSSFDRRDRSSRRQRFSAKAMEDRASLQAAGTGIPVEWWGLENGTAGIHAVQWGDVFDEALTADFDGDGKDDITVWRPAGEGEFAYFLSINSSDFTLRQTAFGQMNDDPYVVGDYDADGIDDPAVFRCPQDAPGTCYFYYHPSTDPNPGFYAVAFGQGQGNSLIPFPGDFNGDGKQDFAVQDESPTNPGNGIFYIGMNGSLDVTGVEWGFRDDFLVPGDFDGDGKSDITVTRLIDNVLWWFVLEQDGGMQFVPWGQDGDEELVGDYNGDGRDDFAVYRPGESQFLIQPSGGGSHFGLTWGQPGDFPVAHFFVR